VEEGIDRDEELRRQFEEMKRQAVVQKYLDRAREETARVSDADARAFYDEHRDEYRTEKMVRVRMLLTADAKIARRAYEMAEHDSLAFADLCQRFSDNDFVVSARGLVPTWLREGRAVPWIGNHQAFHDVVFALEKGQLSEPFETGAGWHVVRVEELREARERPFDEVKKDVVDRIARTRSTRGLPELLAELNERYDVTVVAEAQGMSADELFAQAQSETDATRRVELYDELVTRFPDFDHALDAHFMIGFIRSEELQDPVAARESFLKVIELDPDSDLAQSARWMLSSEGVEPVFEDDGWTPDSQEAAQ